MEIITKSKDIYVVNKREFENIYLAERYLKELKMDNFFNGIMDALEFEVHDDHLKLLKRMYVSWDSCEFGAPGVDSKRPYGNSDVYDDIAAILDQDHLKDEGGDYSEDLRRNFLKRHLEMKNFMQILFNFGEIPSGKYKRKASYYDWEKVQ